MCFFPSGHLSNSVWVLFQAQRINSWLIAGRKIYLLGDIVPNISSYQTVNQTAWMLFFNVPDVQPPTAPNFANIHTMHSWVSLYE